MQRTVRAMVLLAALGGLAATGARAGQYMGQAWERPPENGISWGARYAPNVPNMVGPHGEPVPVMAPPGMSEFSGADFARLTLAQSVPPQVLQAAYESGAIKPAAGAYPPGGCPGGMCAGGACPPGVGMPGMMPGMPGMPGGLPGMPGGMPLASMPPPGAVAAVGALTGPAAAPYGVQRTEVRFVGPAGMRVTWYAPTGEGRTGFSSQYLEAPARYNFLQGAIYRLKLSDIPNRPGVELYPTLEVIPANATTATFLAHSAVPINFTEDDFEQVAAGNFVVKVIYLPNPAFQDLAVTGPDEVVSSRLEPGVDPICEAKRRGCILAIVRIGNIDLEAPNTPAMDAPPPGGRPGARPGMPPGVPPGVPPGMPRGMAPGMMPGMTGLSGPGPMVPYGAVPLPGMTNPAMPAGPLAPGAGLPVPPGAGATPTTTPTPGLPVGKAPAGGVQQAQSAGPSLNRPTVAELAGQPPAPGK